MTAPQLGPMRHSLAVALSCARPSVLQFRASMESVLSEGPKAFIPTPYGCLSALTKIAQTVMFLF